MKEKLTFILILGAFLFFLFGFLNLGLRFQMGLVSFDLDRLIALWIFMGMICAILAYKKNKEPGIGFLAGTLLGPIAILYYFLCKEGMSEKEKEIHEWELEKKYQKMLAEEGKATENISPPLKKKKASQKFSFRLFFFSAGFIILLSFSRQGKLLSSIYYFLVNTFGAFSIFIPIFLFIAGFKIGSSNKQGKKNKL